jgi:hypothetical protein
MDAIFSISLTIASGLSEARDSLIQKAFFLTGFTELTELVGLGQEEIQSSVFRGEARFYPAPRA